jgi:hypothetical protein
MARTRAASTQDDLDTPELAQDANDALVTVLEQSADAFREIADAAEAGDDAAVAAGVQTLMEIGTTEEGVSLDDAFSALSDACPEIDNVGY